MMARPNNPNCDGAYCVHSSGEVRVLPIGGGGNLILCRACYGHEGRYQSDQAYRTNTDNSFLAWKHAEIYQTNNA